MKGVRFWALALCLLAFTAATATAQKRTAKGTTRSTSSSAATLPPLEVRAARDKVDTQLSNVNVWLNKYGPIALNLDAAVADEKNGKLSAKTAKAIDASRDKVVASIRDLKTGLTDLESRFRTTAVLSRYLPMIQGITDLAARSEDAAVAGQFVAAKDPLRDVTKKLTDTLNAMPKAGI
jgi:hypothetical protein